MVTAHVDGYKAAVRLEHARYIAHCGCGVPNIVERATVENEIGDPAKFFRNWFIKIVDKISTLKIGMIKGAKVRHPSKRKTRRL